MARLWHAVAWAVALGMIPGSASAQQDATVTDALVELRVVNGPPAHVLPALVRDTTLLLPFGRLLELVEVRTLNVDPGRRWRAVLQPSDAVLDVRTRDGIASRDSAERRLSGQDAVWRDSALYVATPVVGWLLDVGIGVNWPELTVVVRNTEHLPVVRRLARERRRERLLAPRGAFRPRLDLSQRSRMVDGAVLDWAVTTSTRDPLESTGLDLGLGMQLAGGSLVARHVERATTAGRYTATEVEWAKAWPDRQWLRQAGAGYVTAAGPDPHGILGIRLTNTPFARPRYFADELLDGYLPPGWEVEVYQSGQLVGFSRVDQAGYAVDVPIRYGRNPLTVVAYGPNGERFTTRRSIAVPFDRIPAQAFEYALSAGWCRTEPCRASATADVRYGLLEHLTLRAGTQWFERDTLPDGVHPYAALSTSPHPSLNLSARWTAGAHVAAGVEYSPTPDFELALKHVEYVGVAESPMLGSPTIDRRLSGFLFWRPARHDRAPFVRLDFQHVSGHDTRRDYVRVAGTSWWGPGRIEVGASYYRDRMPSAVRPAQVVGDIAAGAVLGSVFRRAGASYARAELAVSPDSGVVRAFARLAQPVTNHVRVELGGGWQAGRGLRFELNLTGTFDAFRAVSRNRITAGEGLDGLQVAEGSVIWDRHSDQLQVSDGRSVGRAGITGRVFLDADGDGHRDPEEPGVRGLRLRVGAHSAVTDTLGRFSAWDLLPFEPVQVAVDSLSLDNPLWLPAEAAVSVGVGPNSYGYLEIPLVLAGEVSGTVVWAETGRPVPGIELEIVAEGTDAVPTLRTFSDGQFYLFGLRPGSYEVRVTEEARERLRTHADAVRFVIGSTHATRVADGLVLRISSPWPDVRR